MTYCQRNAEAPKSNLWHAPNLPLPGPRHGGRICTRLWAGRSSWSAPSRGRSARSWRGSRVSPTRIYRRSSRARSDHRANHSWRLPAPFGYANRSCWNARSGGSSGTRSWQRFQWRSVKGLAPRGGAHTAGFTESTRPVQRQFPGTNFRSSHRGRRNSALMISTAFSILCAG